MQFSISLMQALSINEYIAVSLSKHIVSILNGFNIHKIRVKDGNGEHGLQTAPQTDKLSQFMMAYMWLHSKIVI